MAKALKIKVILLRSEGLSVTQNKELELQMKKKVAVYKDQFVFLVLGNVLRIRIEYWKRKDG